MHESYAQQLTRLRQMIDEADGETLPPLSDDEVAQYFQARSYPPHHRHGSR